MAFQNNPQMGTWKLNEAKSKFAGKARNHTVVYEASGDQTKVTVDGVDVVEQSFSVEGQHTLTSFGLDLPPGRRGQSDA